MNLKSQKISFGFFRCFAAILFFTAVTVTPLRADDSTTQSAQPVEQVKFHYLKDGKPDAIELLAPPPLPDSAEQKYDLAEVESVCHEAPSNEVAEALSQDKGVSLAYFEPIVGDGLLSGKLPKTEDFLQHVRKDASIVMNNAKDFWKRPRPYAIDPSLAPGKKPTSFSYPSGHSTESMTLALVLADLFPDKRGALIAEARTIGWHRVQIARHFPTDVIAGRVLAQAIVKQMEKDDKFQKDLAEAKAEIAAAQ